MGVGNVQDIEGTMTSGDGIRARNLDRFSNKVCQRDFAQMPPSGRTVGLEAFQPLLGITACHQSSEFCQTQGITEL